MKKLFALILALVMVLSLAACGGDISSTVTNDSDDYISDTTETSNTANDTSLDDDESKNTAAAPDNWTNLLEKHYEEVKEQFEDAGFTNISCVAIEIDFNEDNVFAGSVVNIAVGEDGEICTFEKGEQWPKDIKIRIDYRVKPAQPASEYEKAFVRDLLFYKLYYMFDTDAKKVVFFQTNDTYVENGTYTGDFSTGVTITWSHGEWTEKFTYKSGNTGTLIDGHGLPWKYEVCDVADAQEVLDTIEPTITVSPEQLAREDAETFRQNNSDRIISIYELYDHLSSLGYSDDVCEEVCFENPPKGFYVQSAIYDYERILEFRDAGYSREVIIDFYMNSLSYEDASYLVDECLAGKKLTYMYVGENLELVEVED